MQENELPPSPFAIRPPHRRAPGRASGRHFGAHRALLAATGLAVAFAAGEPTALALQGGEDASTLPVIINKQSGLEGKFQVSLNFSTTLATKYTDSIGGTLNLQYNFNDWLGVEVLGGGFAVSEAQVLGSIRGSVTGFDPKLSDMGGMQWMAGANVVIIPIYGKISFASEWNPSFDLFLVGGGGVVGTARGEVNGAPAAGLAVEPDTFRSSVEPMFNFGGGLRFFITPEWAIRFDVRNYFFTDPDTGNETVKETEISGFTSALTGQAGIQWSFGGDQ